jgi:cob(I)alamin adenosyltransferase
VVATAIKTNFNIDKVGFQMKKGYVQVYTGNGKGKTTAALGLAFRAVGRGFRVIMVQFLKGMYTGELESSKKFGDNFKIVRLAETDKFFWTMNEEEKLELRSRVQSEIKYIFEVLEAEACDILILDEIMGAMHGGIVTEDQVCQMIDARPETMELILTGRNVPDKIFEKADLVTEMKPLKHYIDKGVPARDGIER